MSCKACEEFQATDAGVYWFRWGTANIALLGCRQHIGEVMKVLRDHIRPPAPGTGDVATANGNRSTTDSGDEQLGSSRQTDSGRLGELSGAMPDPTAYILHEIRYPAEAGRQSDSGMPAARPGESNDVDV